MEVLAVVLIAIGIIAVRVISFFYPDWKAIKGEHLSERKRLGYSLAGIGILLFMYILSQFLIRL
ncbi:hypothetical protein GLW00_13210 [Halobacillus litoralis]|uniref:Uncharacterized protein n=1 Tax=Halobacillus litoralis TaxID=45668 RepID=A0A845FDA4_9BACI|nr:MULTISPECIES: hypothetical protein [Halobacillus]MBN9653182.1 hypothetical protein [Halobacillus sp. GSS1]MEC3884770.1 hypothetical protein [Halobacillus sp. HZG1]MYL71819.1 hypothetical protein [Halobacillus litoralis]